MEDGGNVLGWEVFPENEINEDSLAGLELGYRLSEQLELVIRSFVL
jgi:hypothetical protein